MGYATKSDLKILRNEILKEIGIVDNNVKSLRGDFGSLCDKFNEHVSIESRLLEATAKVNVKDYSYNNITERNDIIYILHRFQGKTKKELSNMFELSTTHIKEIVESY